MKHPDQGIPPNPMKDNTPVQSIADTIRSQQSERTIDTDNLQTKSLEQLFADVDAAKLLCHELTNEIKKRLQDLGLRFEDGKEPKL
jgi:hypothetical protein